MLPAFAQQLTKTLEEIKAQGLYKTERVITCRRMRTSAVADGKRVLNMCANNYLGLADHPALDRGGEGGARFARARDGERAFHLRNAGHSQGTGGSADEIPRDGGDDSVSEPRSTRTAGSSRRCSDPEDAIISDELNHASIIDGVRLCKAQRSRYKHNDMADLEAKLKETSGARVRMIATDGCFSMDGTIADLGAICDLADKYGAITMVDDAHATGFLGKTGRGTHEYRDVMGRIDIITGTLGKALGGASGGFTSARKEIVELLRQRSRPYLFSNSVAPPIVAATLEGLGIAERLDRAARQTGGEHEVSSAPPSRNAASRSSPARIR